MSYDDDVPPLLTKSERWLWLFGSTKSVGGVSGPPTTAHDLLNTINDLREVRDDLLAALEQANTMMVHRVEAGVPRRVMHDLLVVVQAAIAKAKLPT